MILKQDISNYYENFNKRISKKRTGYIFSIKLL